MRRFQTTPQKKLVGMLILFVFIPLFLLWYFIFFLGNKPGTDTIIILACVAILAAYFYLRYKRQIDALAAGQPAEELPEEAEEFAEAQVGEAEESVASDKFDEEPVINDSDELEKPVPKSK